MNINAKKYIVLCVVWLAVLVATNIQHCSRPMSGSKIGFAELSFGFVSRDSLVGGVVIPYEAFLARLINLGCQ